MRAANPKVLIDFHEDGKKPAFTPDGMTIDTDGNLYVAAFGSSKVLQVNAKSKKVEMEIKLPVASITSVAFGGPNLDVLFVTTASISQNNAVKQPITAGSVFKVTELGVRGTKMYNAHL